MIKVLRRCNMVTKADILTLFSITSAEGTALTCKVNGERFKTSYALCMDMAIHLNQCCASYYTCPLSACKYEDNLMFFHFTCEAL